MFGIKFGPSFHPDACDATRDDAAVSTKYRSPFNEIQENDGNTKQREKSV